MKVLNDIFKGTEEIPDMKTNSFHYVANYYPQLSPNSSPLEVNFVDKTINF
jgi:hypothetical protein